MLECLFSCCYCLQLKEGLLVFVLPHVPATKHPPFSSAVWVNRFIRIGWSQSRCSLQCQSKLCLHSMLRCPLAAIWAKAESNNSNNNNQTIRSLWLMNLLWANAEFVWMFWEEKGWRNVCIGLVGLFFLKPVYTNAFHNPSKLTAPPASFFGTKKKTLMTTFYICLIKCAYKWKRSWFWWCQPFYIYTSTIYIPVYGYAFHVDLDSVPHCPCCFMGAPWVDEHWRSHVVILSHEGICSFPPQKTSHCF